MRKTLLTLLDLACGRQFNPEDNGRARRGQLFASAMLIALGAAAIWGLAAGSSNLSIALGNLYKVPMVVLLSVLSAIPAGLLAWKLTGSQVRASDLLVSFATSVLAGTLVMAALSPLVALYYNTSAWAGPMLALGSTFSALVVAIVTFCRGVSKRRPPQARGASVWLPVFVVVSMQMVTLLQFIAVASPILPEVTVFDGGIDQVIRK